jgi:hypothetical protein
MSRPSAAQLQHWRRFAKGHSAVASHKRVYQYRSEEAKRASQINGLGVYKSKWSSGMRHVHLGMGRLVDAETPYEAVFKKRNAL